MSAIAEAAEDLETALKGVGALTPTGDELRPYRDMGTAVDPPAAVLGPPRLVWGGFLVEPSTATFLVWIVEKADERAVERLWDWVPLVAAAIDKNTDGVVTGASPGAYSSGGHELPSYELTVEVPL